MDKIVAMGVAYRSLIRNVDLRSKLQVEVTLVRKCSNKFGISLT